MDKLGLGREMEALVADRWTWYGFKCWMPPRGRQKNLDAPVNRYVSQDIWNLFDFIAVKPWCPVNLVQVKRKRRTEAEVALEAIKSFSEAYSAPIASFVVLWHKERATGAIRFEAWELGMLGWMQAGQWSEKA